METIYIVAYDSYEGHEGHDYYAFRNIDAAIRNVDADFHNTISNLKAQEWDVTVACDDPFRKMLYVPDTGIYHEWFIEESTLE